MTERIIRDLDLHDAVIEDGHVQLGVLRHDAGKGTSIVMPLDVLEGLREAIRKDVPGTRAEKRHHGATFLLEHVGQRLDVEQTWMVGASVVACTLERPESKDRREFQRSLKRTIAAHGAARLLGVTDPASGIAWMVTPPELAERTGRAH